jgi:hypothetical protein
MKRFFIQATCILVGLLMFAGCRKGPDRDIEKRIFVNPASLDMFVGEEVQITASPASETFTWESEDQAVATVSLTGEVRAVGAGETNIIVSSAGLRREIPVICAVRVPVTGISLPAPSMDLIIGRTVTLLATLLPEGNNEKEKNTLVWESSNKSVATVERGTVKAVSDGPATISVWLERNPNIKAEMTVTVKLPTIPVLVNATLNKPVRASSVLAGNPAENAVNGDRTVATTNRWVTDSDPNGHWIEVDLETFHTVHLFQMWRDPNYGILDMQEFILQVWNSTDNTWIDVVYEENDRSGEYSKEFEPVTTNKVKLIFLPNPQTNADRRVRMYELEVWGYELN